MVKILHLFPNLMNLYGDYGNITILKKHLEDQGQKVVVDRKDIESKINFKSYDFIYMGSGTETNLQIALNNLLKYKSDFIECVNSGKVILFTGNAMELLGKSIDGKKALGLFDFEVEYTDKRFTGDVIVKNEDLGFIVGFINKSSLIKGGEENKLFDYIFMDNNLQDNEYEGYHKHNTFGTHIIGPVLAKNPDFVDRIVQLLLPKNCKYKNITYTYEIESFIVTLNALKERIK